MTPRPALPLALSLSLASGLLLGSGVATADPPKPAALIPAPAPAPPPPAEPVEMKTRSPEMVVGGFFLGLAGGAALAGGLTYATNPCTGPTEPASGTAGSSSSGAPVKMVTLPCVSPGTRVGVGAGVAAVGGIAVVGGIALIFLGAKQVPAVPGTGAVPAVRVGAGSASATWSF